MTNSSRPLVVLLIMTQAKDKVRHDNCRVRELADGSKNVGFSHQRAMLDSSVKPFFSFEKMKHDTR